MISIRQVARSIMVSAFSFVGSDFFGEIEGGCRIMQGPMRSTAMVVHGGWSCCLGTGRIP